MANINLHFEVDLSEEQIRELKDMQSLAEKENGKIILLFNEDTLKGYIIEAYRIEAINKTLDSRSKKKKSKIKKPKFNTLYTMEKLIEEK